MTNKKQTILLAATAVLKAEGGTSFSMRKVANEAEISLGNLQYHFPTLEDLLAGLLCSFIEEYRSELHSLQTKEPLSEEEFIEIVKELLVEESNDGDFPLLRAVFLVKDDSWIQSHLTSYYAELFGLLKKLISNVRFDNHQTAEQREKAINLAASIILPYLPGYGLVADVIKIGSDALAESICKSALAVLK